MDYKYEVTYYHGNGKVKNPVLFNCPYHAMATVAIGEMNEKNKKITHIECFDVKTNGKVWDIHFY